MSGPGPTSAQPGVEPMGRSRLGEPVVRLLRERATVIRYLAVGAWNTVFGYGSWAVLQFLLGDRLHYLVILLIAWPIAVANAYACYRRLVFRSSGSVPRELPRFALVYVATLLGSLVVLPVLLHVLPYSIYLIQGGYTLAVVVLSYLAHRFFSFQRPMAAAAAGPSAPTAPRAGGDDARS